MLLSTICFKIDKLNAKAMVYGFDKNGIPHRQSIWCAVKEGHFPALITHNRTPTRFWPSKIGEEMDAERSEIPMKYAAKFVDHYFIKNEMPLWEILCTNGLFNIWDPTAPFKRFAEAKSDKSKFRIQLLRIYEIDYEFTNSDIDHCSSRIDHLLSQKREVNIKKPQIPDDEFTDLENLLKNTVAPYRAD